MSSIVAYDENDYPLAINVVRDSADGDGIQLAITCVCNDNFENVNIYSNDNVVSVGYSEFNDFVDSMIEMRESLYQRGALTHE